MGKNKRFLAEQQRITNEGRRAFMQKMLYAGGFLAVCGVGGICSYLLRENPAGTDYAEISVKNTIPSELTFENVVDNEELKQKYIDHLVEKEARITREWGNFEKIIYDPMFKIFQKDAEITDKQLEEIIEMKHIAQSITYEFGKKAKCYISLICFNPIIVACEDDLKSIIDHESMHAEWGLKCKAGNAEFTAEEREAIYKSLSGGEAILAASEAAAYDFQYSKILSGERKVNSVFMNEIVKKNYRKNYKILESSSKKEGIEGKFAREFIKSLKTNPFND